MQHASHQQPHKQVGRNGAFDDLLANSAFDDLLANNRKFAETFDQHGFDGLAKAGVLMITCMDSRIMPLEMVGLTFGGYGSQPMNVVLANVALTTTGEQLYNVNMAAALLTAIPPLAIYFGLGRFFIEGITAGAIKG